MVDRFFSDSGLAALYDALCPRAQRKDFDFYLPMAMSAQSVLDAGCGTGSFLREVRDAGHAGRLCGLDPAAGMLEQARKYPDIEWVQGDLGSVAWAQEFDLIVMTGHAFQTLVGDAELRVALAAVRAALTPRGRFAFETSKSAGAGVAGMDISKTRSRSPTLTAQGFGWRAKSGSPSTVTP